MPEDYRGPSPAHLVDLGVPDMRPRRVGVKAGGLAAMACESPDQGPVARAHVEDRTGRQYPVQAIGERRARTAEHLIPEAGEPARRKAIPAGVGLVQLRIARPRRRRRHAAAGTSDPAGETVVTGVEDVIAPRDRKST